MGHDGMSQRSDVLDNKLALAKRILDEGVCLLSEDKPLQAGEEFDRSIELYLECEQAGQRPSDEDVATAYMLRARCAAFAKFPAGTVLNSHAALERWKTLPAPKRLLGEAITSQMLAAAQSDLQDWTSARYHTGISLARLYEFVLVIASDDPAEVPDFDSADNAMEIASFVDDPTQVSNFAEQIATHLDCEHSSPVLVDIVNVLTSICITASLLRVHSAVEGFRSGLPWLDIAYSLSVHLPDYLQHARRVEIAGAYLVVVMRAAAFNESDDGRHWDDETAPEQLKIACDRIDELEEEVMKYRDREPQSAEARLNSLEDDASPFDAVSTIVDLLGNSEIRTSPTLVASALAKLSRHLDKLSGSLVRSAYQGRMTDAWWSRLNDTICRLSSAGGTGAGSPFLLLQPMVDFVGAQMAIHRGDWRDAKNRIGAAIVGVLSSLGDDGSPGESSFWLRLLPSHFFMLGECFVGEGDRMCAIFFFKLCIHSTVQLLTRSGMCVGASDAELHEMVSNTYRHLDIVRYLNQTGRLGEALFFSLTFGDLAVDGARKQSDSHFSIPMTPAETSCQSALQRWLDWAEGPRTEEDFGAMLKAMRDTLEASRAEADPLSRTLLSELVKNIPLDKSTAFLHYQSLADSLEIFVFWNGSLSWMDVPISDQKLSEDIGRMLALYRDPASGVSFGPEANQAFEHLMAPVLHLLNIQDISRLLISVSGVLRYVPFSALYDGERFLIERFSCVYYSPYASFDHSEPSDSSPRAFLLGRARSSVLHRLPGLPSVLQELRDVRSILESARVKVSMFCDDGPGQEFNLKAVRRALAENPRFLHISTHYVSDPADASRGRLLLGDDTLLGNREVEEIDMQRSNIQMAVISCCSAGAPIPGIKGETEADLTSVLHRKGVQTVLSTLWPIQSDAAAVLISSYYKELFSLATLTREEALRRAQLDFCLNSDSIESEAIGNMGESVRGFGRPVSKTDRTWSHPYYWASFVISGNWLPLGL
jgi:CHAT domain-containing protein